MAMYPQSIVSCTLETKINLFSVKYAKLSSLMSFAVQCSVMQSNVMQCSAVQCSAVLFKFI